VLREIAKGLSDFEIAESLGITKYTVNKHVGAILAKMNVASRTGAAVRAIRDHVA
jgi:DNA-binding NarL/FixJ family response regulator